MKLRNNKTGEIIDIHKFKVIIHYDEGRKTMQINSLEELNEWEDVPEEPEEFFVISPYKIEGYEVFPYDNFGHIYKLAEELGITFKTKEEAEKAVEKLKAWKRLKDKGFKFTGYDLYSGSSAEDKTEGEFAIGAECSDFVDNKDLDILFGDEE